VTDNLNLIAYSSRYSWLKSVGNEFLSHRFEKTKTNGNYEQQKGERQALVK